MRQMFAIRAVGTDHFFCLFASSAPRLWQTREQAMRFRRGNWAPENRQLWEVVPVDYDNPPKSR